uniref:Macaca fascicularis brain cDNA clone: QflA-21245, similar to human cysteine sulfinic acid decarboxylase (CSAD), mRNA, RefSeq: NM_015989.3 n=1 Tax=Macaca fascicularis TaxID=9541 RepID=I7GD43_MACFA|nr:unnamed protein product [Macaca fascicularis]
MRWGSSWNTLVALLGIIFGCCFKFHLLGSKHSSVDKKKKRKKRKRTFESREVSRMRWAMTAVTKESVSLAGLRLSGGRRCFPCPWWLLSG